MVSPGPATLLIAASSASFGWRSTIPLVAGLLTSMVAIMALVGLGIAGFVLQEPRIATFASIVAGLYMAYLAYRIATAPPMAGRGVERRAVAPTYGVGFVLNFVNPKAYAAVGAVFSGFSLAPRDPVADVLTKVLLTSLVILVGHAMWLLVGATFARFVRSQRVSRAINLGFAASLLVSMWFVFLV